MSTSDNEPAENEEQYGTMKREAGHAATLDLESLADRALVFLGKQTWFKLYLIITFGLSLSEPILIAYPNETHTAQIAILVVSTVLWIIGQIALMVAMHLDEHDIDFVSLIRESLLPEAWIEIACFIFGWAFLFQKPSIATIRCLRVFRFFWYSELYKATENNPLFVITRLSHLVIAYLEKIGEELFTYSSKGGAVVLGFFFYLAYILAIVFWQETSKLPLLSPEGGVNGTISECNTIPHCLLIMMRLSFFDGSGFDFVLSLINYNLAGLATLAIFYMIITAFVLLNGLIGIFGDAFQSATEDSAGDDEKDEVGATAEVPTTGGSDSLRALQKMCEKMSLEIAMVKAQVET